MKISSTTIAIFLLFSISLLSCREKQSDTLDTLFDKYLSDVFNLEYHDAKKKYLVIPLESCRSCIESTLNRIENIQDTSLIVIFSGNKFTAHIQSLKEVYLYNFDTILLDEFNQLSFYELDIYKPTYVYYHNQRGLLKEELPQ